uniref:Uncharacterized protein n=1 Tax=Leersia perrieri TaxID=77586 RepID=A0A0D9XFU9_9ORYZ
MNKLSGEPDETKTRTRHDTTRTACMRHTRYQANEVTRGRPHLAGRLLMMSSVRQAQSCATAPSAEQQSAPGTGSVCPGAGGTLYRAHGAS